MNLIKKHIKAVIFDMDGTIIKSEHIWQNASHALLIRRGINPLTDERAQKLLHSFSGIGLHSSVALIKEKFGLPETIEELANEKRAVVLAEFARQSSALIFDGFAQFHQLLTQHGIPNAIGTNADLESLNYISNAVGLDTYFPLHTYSISHVNNQPKPSPAVFLFAAQQLGVNPTDCVVFEDSLYGFLAAKEAGMACIAIQSSLNQEHLHHAESSIAHYKEAIDALRTIAQQREQQLKEQSCSASP